MIMNEPVVTIVVPTKDRTDILLVTLDKILEAFGKIPFELIIVNDSEIPIVLPDVIAGFVRVVRNPGRGVASARNTGASMVNSKWIWFIDDDIWLNQSLVSRVHSIIADNKEVVFNFNWIYPPDLQARILAFPFGRFLTGAGFTTMKGWCRGVPWKDNAVFPAHGLAGATLLIPKSVYFDVNGYDSTFPLAGFEDHDFSCRVLAADIPCYIDTTVVAHHNEVGKTVLNEFLKRAFDNSVTRAHAVKIGYVDQSLKYTAAVKVFYSFFSYLQGFVKWILNNWPNIKALDPLYAFICHRMIGFYSYNGFNHGMNS